MSSASEEKEELLVIGAGLPRTGTTSLSVALPMLLGGKCYHMANVLKGSRTEGQFWMEMVGPEKKTRSPQEWKDFLPSRGFNSAVDYPPSLFYDELMQVFPNAKLVMTVRNPATWHDSVCASVKRMCVLAREDFAVRLFIKIMRLNLDVAAAMVFSYPKGLEQSMVTATDMGPEASKEFFEAWVARVKSKVPADRLLIFEAKEGWKPLCEFLGVPEPNVPYPRVNDSASFIRIIRIVKALSYFTVYVIPTIVGYLVAKKIGMF